MYFYSAEIHSKNATNANLKLIATSHGISAEHSPLSALDSISRQLQSKYPDTDISIIAFNKVT